MNFKLLIIPSVFIMQSCVITTIKPENYTFSNKTIPIKVHSNALASYNYIPIINSRDILVSVYAQSEQCSDNFNGKAKYLYSQEYVKELSSKYLKLPENKNIFIKIKNHWATPGAARINCFQVLSFRAEKDKNYELQIDLVSSNFPRGYICPIQLKAYKNNKPSIIQDFKDLTYQHELFNDGVFKSNKCES